MINKNNLDDSKEVDPMELAKKIILENCKEIKRREGNHKKELPHSAYFSKLEIPIFYSNLITIEDMKFENSCYYLSSSGFLTSNIRLQSIKHSKSLEYHDCIFRIYPKTYNINKYKILDSILQNKSKFNTSNLQLIITNFI